MFFALSLYLIDYPNKFACANLFGDCFAETLRFALGDISVSDKSLTANCRLAMTIFPCTGSAFRLPER
ncbi:MAG: hypothetical protein J5680_01210 [Neisseriaceae bacterium]|nr:hypothetical protein [Neisseriaceae bacterium]